MSYYFISGNLPNQYGGLTKSLLLRSKLFGSLKQTQTSFLTFGFDLSFHKKVEALYKKKIIDPEYTDVINLYEDFLSDVATGKRIYEEKKSTQEIQRLAHPNKFLNKFKELLRSPKEKLDVSYYKNNKHVRSVRYLTQDDQLIKKEDYAENNRLATVSYYEVGSSDPYLIEFLNHDQIVYLEKRFTKDSNTKESTLSIINWYADSTVLSFTDESDLRRYWIQSIQADSDKPKLFLVDSRPQDKHVFEVPKAKNSYYAAIIHNKHYEDHKSHIKGRYKKIMAHRFDLDAIFFITKEQLHDFTQLTGKQSNYFYTPHTIDRELDVSVLSNNRNPQKAVIISRLAKMKNVEDAVKAFALVVKEIPSAVLEIYGSGDQEKVIKKKIEELNMHGHILLKGHTSNPDAEFQSAALTISTSHFEGFGLSNMEALGNGCPVVTYDYDYGARSMVKDGYNGYIVEQYNVETLATKIVELMNDEAKHDEFAKNAFDSASAFTPDQYITHWSNALNKMIEQKQNRIAEELQMKGLSIKLVEIPTSENQKILFKMESNQPILNANMTLIGIDRRFKEEVIRVSVNDNQDYLYAQIESSDIGWKTVTSNNVKKIDFYVEIENTDGVKILKRVSSKVVKDTVSLIFEDRELDSYSTKHLNYSWTV